MQGLYERSLGWVLEHAKTMLAVMLATFILNVVLFERGSQRVFPQQDTGRLTGSIQADQNSSFQAMQQKLAGVVQHRLPPIRRSRP